MPIAGLAGLPPPPQIDVSITLGELPPEVRGLADDVVEAYYTSPFLDERGEPTQKVYRSPGGDFFRIQYSDGTVIAVDAKGNNVWATWPDSATVEDTATYLLGPTLGFILRLRGVTCLHASAIAVGGRAIALVGPSGSGKSSTAAAFAQLGYGVLSDDVVPLTDPGDGFIVQPAYPRIRLWPASTASLFGSVDALPRITPGWDKRFLDLNGPRYRFQQSPLPLAAIYLLGERSSDIDQPLIAEINPQAAFISLVAETYTNYLLTPQQRASEFEIVGRLVAEMPIRRVTPCAGFDKLPALCGAIVEDFAGRAGARMGADGTARSAPC
jgi:hypothetical protein